MTSLVIELVQTGFSSFGKVTSLIKRKPSFQTNCTPIKNDPNSHPVRDGEVRKMHTKRIWKDFSRQMILRS